MATNGALWRNALTRTDNFCGTSLSYVTVWRGCIWSGRASWCLRSHTGMEAAFWFYNHDTYSVPAHVMCTRQRVSRETWHLTDEFVIPPKQYSFLFHEKDANKRKTGRHRTFLVLRKLIKGLLASVRLSTISYTFCIFFYSFKLWALRTIMSVILLSVCMQVKKQQSWTWNNKLVPNEERSTSRLYIFTLLI